MHLKENTTLQGGRYRIIRTLGQGGFGITYLAEDTRFGETVAIKEFFIRQFCNRDEDTLHVSVGVKAMKETVKEFYDKFFREAQKTRKLKHRNIIKITDLFPENGTAYYVMDYHPGGSLGSLIRKQGALNEEQALRYIRQVASALKLIHSNNMAHLDIKPDNILLDDEDNAIVIDFGISKHYDEKGNATTITPGAYTPGYAADSQMVGGKISFFSPTLDIYSLGATLYNLVTGKEPPISAVIINYGFPALPDRISWPTCNAIKKAMEPKSANRPQSVDEFLSVLDSRNATLPGRLFVTTSPAGATVTVDGKHIGNTPIERYELKKGVYTLKITKEGYNTISKNITISNDPAIINVALTTIEKQQVKNSKEKNNQSNKPTKQEVEKYNSDGVKAYNVGNYTEAVKCFRKAAEQGYAAAQCNLGVCYEYSKGLTKDLNEAVKWYRKAVEQGYAHAQYRLALCYDNGRGVQKDYSKAVKFYRKAAEQGNVYAQYNLGVSYEYSTGVAKDLNEAVKWYRKAAEQGYAHAQYKLGFCYEYSTGVIKNLNEAVKWYRKAAEQGNADAQNKLALCYEYGTGVTIDLNEAVKWYRKAAEQGNTDAQYNLGFCYEYSKGVIKNLNEAAEWYRKAAEQGNENAKAALLRLFPPLPAEKTSSDSNATNRATEQKSAKAANVSRATQQMNKNGSSRSTQQMNNPTVKNKQDRTANGSRGNEKARKSFNWKPLVGIIAAILCIIFAGVGINECNDYRDEQQRLAAIEKARQDSIAAADKKRNAFETKIFNVNGIEFTMVPVDGGTFNMGSDNKNKDERPVHSVTHSDYYIGETEVTQELWLAVMGSNPSYFKGDKYPVERVSYNDCIDFINKLNTLLADQLPDGRKFRLPTEAQWEFAARGGNRSKGYKYSGSNNIGEVAWYGYGTGNSNKRTHPVKQKQPNELGLYDMSGNVCEWCSDWKGSYSSSPQTNPEGPSNGEYRVLRGGGWNYIAQYCRVAYRINGTPGIRIINSGLRLAIE